MHGDCGATTAMRWRAAPSVTPSSTWRPCSGRCWSITISDRAAAARPGPPIRMKRLLLFLVAAVFAGCSPKPVSFNATDITGGSFDPAFELTDHTGARRSLADFRGKVVTVFFGFTQCPDVCPGTLIEMKEVMALLGDDAERVQTLFITVDPERDTPEVLAAYVPAFDQRFLGLYGTPDEIAKVARGYRVFYEKVPGSSPE